MIGRTLSHYKIVGQIGAGGMGVVYSAEDARLGRQVALKFVSSDFAHDEQAILRLRSEARAASALNHPNICTIYDIGESDGHPFIVMELMKGQSLRDRLNSGSLKITQLVDIGIEVADALHAAHSEGIIHRDIKPGNIFITERGHVKILDFGLAKLTSTLTTTTTTDRAPHTSAAGVTHGTPAYMSPEQATGETLDARTDLFSLGVVLYECATGHHPFAGKTSAVVLAGILDRAPASPLTYNADLPVRLVEVVSNCLEKDRELRYQSAADLRADLKRLRRDLDSGAVRSIERSGAEATTARGDADALRTSRPASQRDVPAPLSASATVTIATGTHRPRKAGAVWAAVAIATVAVIAAVAAITLWPRATDNAATTATDNATTTAPPVAAPAAPAAPVSIEAPLTAANASFTAGNYRAALTSAREVLAIDPANPAAAKIRDGATAMLAKFDAALNDARRRLSAGDHEGAARMLETARSIDPSSPTLAELSGRLSETRGRETTRPTGRTVAPEPSRPAPSPAPSTPAPAAPPPPVVAAPPPPVQSPVIVPPPPPPQPAQVAPPPRATEPPQRTETVPAPAKEATPSPSAPPAGTGDADDTAIRSVIASYGRAIEGKDIKLFRSIKPNLSAQEERRLQEGFRAVTSQRVSLTVISLDRKGDQASAVVRRRDDIEAGGRRQTTDTRQVLALSRSGSTWVITEIR